MAKPGPKPTPDEIKRQNGTFRSERAIGDTPVVPGVLTAKEMSAASEPKAYQMFEQVFDEVGILSKQDSFTLKMLAREWVYFTKLCRMLTPSKILYTKTSSTSDEEIPKLNPLTKEYDASFKRLKGLLAEFGAGPSSRASVAKMVKETDAADELLKLFASRFKNDEDQPDDLDDLGDFGDRCQGGVEP